MTLLVEPARRRRWTISSRFMFEKMRRVVWGFCAGLGPTTTFGAMAVCCVYGCTRPPRALGFCEPHYRRYRKDKPLDGPFRPHGVKGCSVKDCKREHAARGLCHQHWREKREPPRFRQRTLDDVQKIRDLSLDGVSYKEIARRLGCSPSTVARIVKGQSFPNV